MFGGRRQSKTILITGATSGIGLELAKLYSSQELVLIGRKALDELDDSIFDENNYCQTDLSQAGFLATITAFLQKQNIDVVDLVIQNAAIGYFGELNSQNNIDELLKTNLYAPIALSHALLPKLSANGKIVFINSIAANLPAAEYSVYAASKAALAGFARNLALEEAKKIQTIYLGAVKTDMHKKSGVPEARFKFDKFPSVSKTTKQIVSIIKSNQREHTIGTINQLTRRAGKYGLVDILSKNPVKTKTKVCAITGAASGIGRALLAEYLAKGFKIIAIDRDENSLIKLKNSNISVIVADLASDKDLEKLVNELSSVDIFIHSAGISAVGRFIKTDLAKQKAVLDVNLRAVLILTKELLARNKISKGGSIVFVSSLSHQASYPGAAVYAASKDGISSFARSLRFYLKDVHVLTVYPGPTRTPHAAKYSPDNSNENKRMLPAVLAKKIYNSVEQQKSSLVPSFALQVFARAGTYFPHLTEQLMLKTLYKKMEKSKN